MPTLNRIGKEAVVNHYQQVPLCHADRGGFRGDYEDYEWALVKTQNECSDW